jgi:hypothetical protein
MFLRSFSIDVVVSICEHGYLACVVTSLYMGREAAMKIALFIADYPALLRRHLGSSSYEMAKGLA